MFKVEPFELVKIFSGALKFNHPSACDAESVDSFSGKESPDKQNELLPGKPVVENFRRLARSGDFFV